MCKFLDIWVGSLTYLTLKVFIHTAPTKHARVCKTFIVVLPRPKVRLLDIFPGAQLSYQRSLKNNTKAKKKYMDGGLRRGEDGTGSSGDWGSARLRNLSKVKDRNLDSRRECKWAPRQQHAFTLVKCTFSDIKTRRKKKAHTGCRNLFILPLMSLAARCVKGYTGRNCNKEEPWGSDPGLGCM